MNPLKWLKDKFGLKCPECGGKVTWLGYDPVHNFHVWHCVECGEKYI